MKFTLKIISYLGLAATIIPSVLVFNGAMDLKTHFTFMVVGMAMWFLTSPFWMKKA